MTLIRLAVLAIVVAGCSISIDTVAAPQQACLLARVGGVLTWDAEVGLGLLRDPDRGPDRVVWPFGYSARWEPGGVVLIAADGSIVAREGDQIVSAGFSSDDGTAHPCGVIVVEP